MNDKEEQKIKNIKRQITEYLGIDERYIEIEGDRHKCVKITGSKDGAVDFGFLKISKFKRKILSLGWDLSFAKCAFDCELLGNSKKIGKKIYFESCIFKKKVDFSESTFENEANFSESTFENEANFSESTFEKEAIFFNSMFQNQANFSEIIFSNQVIFSHAVFSNQANFSNSIFSNQVIFFNSIFQNEANFARSTFQDIVSFNSVLFKDMIYFLEVRFERGIDLVNSQLRFSFDVLRSKIENEDKGLKVGKANFYRDTFRLLKQSLIKDGNLLDASTYHRAELYAKELELKNKDSKTFKDKIDRYVLAFYRYTSDHHTDLPKILRWVLVSIGVFGIALFGIRYGCNLQGFLEAHSRDLPFAQDILNQNWLNYQVCFMIGFYIVMGLSLCLQGVPTPSGLWRTMRRVCIVPFALVVLAMIYIQPKYILGIGSLFVANYSGLENLLIAAYSIVMFLLLFSLQKTARKNSIVPS